MTTTTSLDTGDALAALLRKYAVQPAGPWRLCNGRRPPECDTDGVLVLVPGWSQCDADLPEQTVPLRPWRSEQRFIELKRLVDEQTIVPVLMCRFACLTDGNAMPLAATLYREFDLAEWLVGASITGIYAAIDCCRAANVILRLSNDVVCSVETGVTLPPGSPMHDRHELIARRGVASDRAVDTQVAQSSISAWTDSGTQQYTDTDAELFGLGQDQVSLARSAYEALRNPECVSKLRAEHVRLRQLVELAYESDRLRQRMAVEGVYA